MEFLDYEKIIKDNYPILIEGYVKQYGEQYREHITNVLSKIKFCIYETPTTILEYVNRKIREDFMKAILDSYLELGIDISEIKFGENGFVFHDINLANLTNEFFPVLEFSDKIKERGIFTFDDKFDNLDLDNPIFKERIKILENINKKDKNISVGEYITTSDYLESCNLLKKTISIFWKNILRRCDDDYGKYYKYASELEEKINLIGKKYQEKFFLSIRKYLSKDDNLLLDKGADIKDLSDYCLFFNPSSSWIFSNGLLEYFCDGYNDLLQSKQVSKKQKLEIVDKRIEYLRRKGFDVSTLDRSKLFCDWSEIDYLKDYLPDIGIVSECLLIRDKITSECERDIAQACIINDYRLEVLDSEISTIISSNGQSYSFDMHKDSFDPENIVPIVCLCPLNDTYNLFDIALDHEFRHAIELYIKQINDGYLVKIGSEITELDSNFCCVRLGAVNYNERVTQKLSIEACRDRWEKHQFIFSDFYALYTNYCISYYDYDIDNLNIIFEPFREELIESQISSDFNKIYEVIPKKILRRIDSHIFNNPKENTEILYSIRDMLLERRLVASKVKKYKNNKA